MNQAVRSGGPQLSPTDMNRIAKILKADAGIEIPEGKTTLVQARLTRRLRATGAQDYHAYCALLEGPDSQAEREHLLSALTTNVTKFFREDHHFDDLKARILPPCSGALGTAARSASGPLAARQERSPTRWR